MSRYRGPKIRIVRRLGRLPGFTAKKTDRDTLPGQHKQRRLSKRKPLLNYSIRLQEKQKLRYNYGLTEKQLLNYIKEAKRLRGSTGVILIQLLEMRLDNIVFRLGFGNTIPASRQIVNHGHIFVNDQKVTIPSFQCQPDDTIQIKDRDGSRTLANEFLKKRRSDFRPPYLEFNGNKLCGRVKRIASSKDSILKINPLLIVEFYSRK